LSAENLLLFTIVNNILFSDDIILKLPTLSVSKATANILKSSSVLNSFNVSLILKSSVAEPHHVDAVPAPRKNFPAVPVPAASAPTLPTFKKVKISKSQHKG
jgi:hypothetical protein